jgi:hypothetical protein
MGVTIPQIISDMSPFRDPNKLNSEVPVYTGAIRETPFIGTKGMQYRAEMKSMGVGKKKLTDAPLSYLVYVYFQGVDYKEERDAKHKFPVDVLGKLYWYSPIDINTSTVRVKCSDPDFRYRFEKELYDVGALIGNWRRYKPVPNSGRPPANPQERLGFCKHIWSLLNLLKKQGKIYESGKLK